MLIKCYKDILCNCLAMAFCYHSWLKQISDVSRGQINKFIPVCHLTGHCAECFGVTRCICYLGNGHCCRCDSAKVRTLHYCHSHNTAIDQSRFCNVSRHSAMTVWLPLIEILLHPFLFPLSLDLSKRFPSICTVYLAALLLTRAVPEFLTVTAWKVLAEFETTWT